MSKIVYGDGANTTAEELSTFYSALGHEIHALPEHIERMMANSAVFVTARVDGKLIGLARGVSDGLRGYLTECKLDPSYQGPAAVTRRDGRIEDDTRGVAAEMARRVLQVMFADGVKRVDTLAWGTEEDFAEELGFKRAGGLVALTLHADEWIATTAQADAVQG
jgi:hypothetical protein